jgi:hypothetical protein
MDGVTSMRVTQNYIFNLTSSLVVYIVCLQYNIHVFTYYKYRLGNGYKEHNLEHIQITSHSTKCTSTSGRTIIIIQITYK